MKKILLLGLVLSAGIYSCANAVVSVDRTISQDYVRNSGYSTQTYNTMQVSRARALGKEFYSAEEIQLQNSSKPVKFFKKLYSYFDPAADDYSFYHHDIKITPGYEDL